MVFEWWRSRRRARTTRLEAEREALEIHVRERTRELIGAVAGPLVEAGVARIEWDKADPDTHTEGVIELVPGRAGAASVAVDPAPDWVTLCPGAGLGHEILIDEQGGWEDEVRTCLEAVIEGRYREHVSSGRFASRTLTMTFEQPDGEDTVVKHYAIYKGAEDDLPLGERRYAAYR